MAISMEKILKAMLFTPVMKGGGKFTGKWGLPVMFVGGPGEAKTSIIEEVAASCGLLCETLSPGERGEGAFGVIPVPQDGVLTYPVPDWTLKFMKVREDGSIDPDGEAGLVFVDEANTGGPVIEIAICGLVLAGRIAGSMLPNRVRRMGAMNEESDAANGHQTSAAFNNRWGWMPWTAPSALSYSSYWLSGAADVLATCDAAAEEARILAAWGPKWADTVGKVTAFCQRSPGWVTENRNPEHRAYASRRSVASAMHAICAAEVHGLNPEERTMLVQGFVGEAWWKAYCAFIERLKVPSPEDVLDGKVKFTHDIKRLDLTYLMLSTATSHVIGLTDPALRKKRGEALWTLIETTLADSPDLAQMSAEALARHSVAVTHKHAIKVMGAIEGFEEKLKKI